MSQNDLKLIKTISDFTTDNDLSPDESHINHFAVGSLLA